MYGVMSIKSDKDIENRGDVFGVPLRSARVSRHHLLGLIVVGVLSEENGLKKGSGLC